MKSNNFLNSIAILIIFSIFIVGCRAAKEEPITEIGEEIADTGALSITSSPASAEVYVDGELKGDTPLDLYNLPVGTYDIAIKKEGYNNFEKTIVIKVGKTEEMEIMLNPLAPLKSEVPEGKAIPEEKVTEEAMPENKSIAKLSKINLSNFAMYYDFEKAQFTETRTDKSDLFSRKYDTYIHFTALTPAKIFVLNKPIKDAQKEDCIFSDTAVAQLFSGQTLCIKTMEGSIVAMGGAWQAMPSELEWQVFS